MFHHAAANYNNRGTTCFILQRPITITKALRVWWRSGQQLLLHHAGTHTQLAATFNCGELSCRKTSLWGQWLYWPSQIRTTVTTSSSTSTINTVATTLYSSTQLMCLLTEPTANNWCAHYNQKQCCIHLLVVRLLLLLLLIIVINNNVANFTSSLPPCVVHRTTLHIKKNEFVVMYNCTTYVCHLPGLVICQKVVISYQSLKGHNSLSFKDRD